MNCKTGHRWVGWLQAATLTAGVAIASTAHAQADGGVTGQQSGTVSVVNPLRSATLRTTSPTTKQHWISREDCVANVKLTFRVSVGSASMAASLYGYVGKSASSSSTTVQDSCLFNAARNDPARCKPLTVGVKNANLPLVVITAQELNALFGIEGCGEATPDDSAKPLSLQFYFLLEPLARDLVSGTDNFAVYDGAGIDVWGPTAPTSVQLISGDEELQLEFAGASGGDVTGFHFFSDDGTGLADGGVHSATSASGGSSSTATAGGSNTSTAATGAGGSTSAGAGGAGGTSTSSANSTSTGAGGAGGAGGASTSSASGTSTGGGAGGIGGAGGVSSTVAATTGAMMSAGVVGSGNTNACNPTMTAPTCVAASNLLVAGQVPDYERAGELLSIGTRGSITGLKNGQAYVVGVAAYDDVGNVGKLSELTCGTPQPVNSILRAYECGGGLEATGCGFCSVGGDRGASYTALVSAGLFVFGFAVRRSRRPRVASAARGAR